MIQYLSGWLDQCVNDLNDWGLYFDVNILCLNNGHGGGDDQYAQFYLTNFIIY